MNLSLSNKYESLRRIFCISVFFFITMMLSVSVPIMAQDYLLITEVYYDPSGTEPDEEWIEIYNPGTSAVDLSEFKIGDEETQGGGEGMFQFPDGSSIAAEGVQVVANNGTAFEALYGFSPTYELNDSSGLIPDMIEYGEWAAGSVSLSNSGDEVLILDAADAAVDVVTYENGFYSGVIPHPGVTGQGQSIERCPADQDTDDCSQDFREETDPSSTVLSVRFICPTPGTTSTPTMTYTGTQPQGTPTPTPTLGPYPLITETLYNGVTEPDDEGIEIYNPHDFAIDLSQYKIGDEETQGGGEGMFIFPAGTTIDPDQVIVIANNGLAFEAEYGVTPDLEFVNSSTEIPDMLVYESWGTDSIALGNSGDHVLLLGPSDVPVDVLIWDGADFPGVTPHPGGCGNGESLERCPADQDTDNCAEDFLLQSFPSMTFGSVRFDCPTQIPTYTLTPSPTGPTATPTPTTTHTVSDTLVISEVIYDALNEPQGECIEIYNMSGETIDLSVIKVGDEEEPGGSEGMFVFPAGSEIASGQVVLIANEAEELFQICAVIADYELNDSRMDVPDMVPYVQWSDGNVALSNSGDQVILLDEADSFLDVVTYEGGSFTGVIPHPGVVENHSLERNPANQDTNDCSEDFLDQEDPCTTLGFVTTGPTTPSPTPTLTGTPTVSPTATATDTPTVTPTGTLPTMTPTRTPTLLPTSTLTPTSPPTHTPTITPSPTSSPLPTDTPTYTPTNIPSLTPTDAPTQAQTPTLIPTPRPLGVYLSLSEEVFHPFDLFLLEAEITNPGPETYVNVPFVVVLEVVGLYFWYPAWTEDFAFEFIDLDAGSYLMEILNFEWPDEPSSFAGAKFYGAMLNQDFDRIFGEFTVVQFGWEP